MRSCHSPLYKALRYQASSSKFQYFSSWDAIVLYWDSVSHQSILIVSSILLSGWLKHRRRRELLLTTNDAVEACTVPWKMIDILEDSKVLPSLKLFVLYCLDKARNRLKGLSSILKAHFSRFPSSTFVSSIINDTVRQLILQLESTKKESSTKRKCER